MSGSEAEDVVDFDNDPHFTVSFLFNDKEVADKLIDAEGRVPSTSEPTQLNALVNKTIKAADDLWVEKTFDFLIGTNFLRNSLDDYVKSTGISTESVIKIQCIVRKPAPEPDQDEELPHDDWIKAVCVTDKLIVSSTENARFFLWTHDGRQLFRGKVMEKWYTDENPIGFGIRCIGVSNSNRIFVGLTGGDISVYDVLYGRTRVLITRHATLKGHERSVNCVAVDKNGTRLISGGFDNYLKVWNIDPDEMDMEIRRNEHPMLMPIDHEFYPLLTLGGHRDAIAATSWMPESEHEVVTASRDHDLIVWDLTLAGQKTRMHSQKSFTALSVNSFNSTIITGSTDPTIRLWDPRSPQGCMKRFKGHNRRVTGVCWSTTKDHLFISSSSDSTVKMWDVRIATTPLYTFLSHTDRVLCCDWTHPDIIASGGVDTTLKIFRMS